MDRSVVYKICTQKDWEQALESGEFRGATIDLQDGYIHFSASHQVRETAIKHFRGQADLVLVAVDASALGEELKWEVSRGGDEFPHLYAPLPTSAATAVHPLPLNESDDFDFPVQF